MKDPERRSGKAESETPPPADADADAALTIGEIAADLDMTTRAIRFYESKGLITPKRRGVARFYTRRDRARLILILRGKNLGFSLEEIKEYLTIYDADPTQQTQLKHLQARVETHIEELNQKRADIERTLNELKSIRAQVAAHLRPR